MKKSDFIQFAHRLLGDEVQVVTTVGPYFGKLKFVGDDVLGLKTHMGGNQERVVIRIEEVVALFKIQHDGRGHFRGAGESSSLKESSSFKF